MEISEAFEPRPRSRMAQLRAARISGRGALAMYLQCGRTGATIYSLGGPRAGSAACSRATWA